MAFGNRKGWALAGTILAVEAMGVWFALSLDERTPPTALFDDPAAVARIALPVDSRTIVPRDQPGDAGPLLRAAVDDYLADPSRYDSFIRELDRGSVEKLVGIGNVVAASRLNDGRPPFADRAATIVVYGESPTVTAIERMGTATIAAGRVVEKDDPTRARQFFEAAFSLGARAFDERLSYRELNAGVTLMSTSAGWMSELAKRTNHPDEVARLDRFSTALRDYAKARLLPTIEAIYTFDDAKISEHAGDVFEFATRSDERVWRIESILKLGRMRFNVGVPGRAGDQRNAVRLLEQFDADEGDPVVRRAIELARGLTVEDYRMIR